MMLDKLIAKKLVPDILLRFGMRILSKARLQEQQRGSAEECQKRQQELVEIMRRTPSIAVHTSEANQQHYELPAGFFEKVLGKNLKYSCAYYPSRKTTLDQAEDIMLEMYCQRAEIKDGMKILELGCGWGSLTLFMAKKFPKSQITAISNSHSQRRYIEAKAKTLQIKNIKIITKDINQFTTKDKFQRIVSIEMFEHVRNYQKLFEKVYGFLASKGKLFIHIFAHQRFAYLFEVKNQSDWMSKYFFTGGTMPSNHLFLYFTKFMTLEKHWLVDGTHYSRTSEDWLKNFDRHRKDIQPIFAEVYGKEYKTWMQYWRIFFMAVSELFKYNKGKEWVINHYLFSKD